MNEFAVKDSGQRESLAGGMVRDTEEGKTDYSLIYDGPMLDRWAEHLTKGAKKYEPRNWMKAGDSTDFDDLMKTKDRFLRSYLRHQRKWMKGEQDEDHVAAMFFNLNGYEYIRGCIENLYKKEANTTGPSMTVQEILDRVNRGEMDHIQARSALGMEPRRPEDRSSVVHRHYGVRDFHKHPLFNTQEEHFDAHGWLA